MRPDPTAVAVRFAKKWKKLPPGWTDKSVEKFWKTLGKGTPEHKVWNCIEKMDGHIPNTGAFCGGLADWQMPGWRKKNKKESPEARSDAKSYWKGKIKKKMKGKKAMTTASAARVALRFAARSGPPMQMGSAAMLKKQGLTPVDVFFGEVRPHRRPIIELGDMVQTRRGDLLYFAGLASDGNAVLGKDEKEAERLHSKIIKNRLHHSTRAASRDTYRDYLKRLRAIGRGRPISEGAWDVWEEHNDKARGDHRKTTKSLMQEWDSIAYEPGYEEHSAHLQEAATASESLEQGDGRHPALVKLTRAAFNSGPLMLQPDYGHGDAAVPGDQEYHPCQHGGECQCGGQCGCGK